jgi:pimeloyl-ACP methyl ester carboxylesterase
MPDVPLPQTRFARSNGIDLAYESFGDEAAPAMLLVMGLGAQMIAWDTAFCGQLAGRGFRVVRFDNRDIGMSAKLTQAGRPDIRSMMFAAMLGKRVSAPYLLRDMADDAAGLLDALGIERAHVVGASMGGAIGQEMAIHHPSRVHTLTSIMATTGAANLPPPTPEAMGVLMARVPSAPDAYLAHHMNVMRVLRGPGFEEEAAGDAERGRLAFARGLSPDGVKRQLAAVIASGDRTAALRSVRVPTLVIHGEADPLVRVEGGVATAAAIPGARLLRIPAMGHALPRAHWPQIVGAIAAHATAAAVA